MGYTILLQVYPACPLSKTPYGNNIYGDLMRTRHVRQDVVQILVDCLMILGV